ncbi:hypothetical protein M8J76_000677 [Diaphorina citri]|nr:hypothetical protein M8J75_006379 [Diaphorina citri]KAI5740123.1 hypothetical protein M8J76_000677 [Diaphorina citri]
MSLPKGHWILESLHQYDGKQWVKTESKYDGDLQLFLQEDNLHITQSHVLVEQMCLSSERQTTRAIFHQNTLGFILHRPQGITKFNVKFSPKCLNIDVCLKHIGTYMKIQMTNQGNTNMVPQNYPVEQIVQLCLLDKELPHFVAEVETILNQYKKETPQSQHSSQK